MDRKAWIIVTLCIAALGVNIYFSNENQKAQQKAEAARIAAQPVAPSPTQQAAPTATPAPPKAGLVVEPPKTAFTEKTWDIVVNRDVNGQQKPVTKFTFTNLGGALRSVEMMDTAIDSRNVPDANVIINESTEVPGIGTLTYGLSASADPIFDTLEYERLVDSNPDIVKFKAVTPDGLTILKEYKLDTVTSEDGKRKEGSDYMLRLKISFKNTTDHPTRIANMGIFAGGGYPVAKSEQKEAFTHFFYLQNGSFEQERPDYFTGGFLSSAKAREFVTKPGITYAGVMSQYYVTAIIPIENSAGESVFAKRKMFHLSHQNDLEVPGVELSLGAPVIDLNPGQIRTLEYEIYAGPKLNQVLRELPYDLKEVMAYGWFTFISVPMNWLLNLFQGWFGNWGVAIICMTIVVRLLMWPLHKKSYMSMKRMSLVQPRLQELKAKYGDDQQKMSAEMMKLYKEYGINPLSGCLPMLVQIPIFFAFYRVLQYSAELRGQGFMLWVKDLSLPDTVFEIPLNFLGFTSLPINILPILMAITMVIQMKMTPQAGDKMQQRIMTFMPLIFFFFCYNFASALALYWTVQNLISMGQTQLIRRLPQPELTKTKKAPGFFQRMMEQQRILMEQQQRDAKNRKGGNMRNVTPKKKK